MKTDSDIYRKSGNNRKTREIRIPEQKRETPAPREAYGLNEHLNNRNKAYNTGCANLGSSESDLVSVCVKGKVLVYKNNVINNNMINENKR